MLWLYIFNQGAWEMEGDMMKGKFTRKDNNKLLTTTRTLVGGELVQVSRSKGVDPEFSPNKQTSPQTIDTFCLCRATTMKGWMPRGFSRSSNLDIEVQILFLYKSHSPVNCIWSYCWHLAYFTRRIMVTMFMKHWNGHTAQLNLHPFSCERRKQTLNSILAVDIYL